MVSDLSRILILGFLVTCVAPLEQDGGILCFFILFLEEVPALTDWIWLLLFFCSLPLVNRQPADFHLWVNGCVEMRIKKSSYVF